MLLKILFIGDIVGQQGCQFLRSHLPTLKQQLRVDLTIANGENSAIGNGILPNSANYILDSGVDVITNGNHVFRRKEILSYLDEHPQVIRPANYPAGCVGNGYYIYDGGKFRVCIVNLMGVVFLENLENPFYAMDRILKETAGEADCYFLDFHAEATGEKKALAYYLDGRVSCLVGTHTHVQTADEQILPQGTGYITDVGMTGPRESVLGVNPQNVIQRYLTAMPTRFTVLDGPCQINGIVAEIDLKTRKCIKIERIILNK